MTLIAHVLKEVKCLYLNIRDNFCHLKPLDNFLLALNVYC